MTDLAYMPATEAVARFKARTLSPVELMEAVIARAEAVEPTINAFAARYYDEALDKARKADPAVLISFDVRDGQRTQTLTVADTGYHREAEATEVFANRWADS